MAAGWPVKTTYIDGDVYSASDVNDANGTLNYINPTSATDLQVLTRDNASPGKVKWANSPANIATTTGDILYASGANTLSRLAIGATDQVLKVSGGVPAWGNAPSAMTLIATNTISGSTSTFSSIPSTYKHLKIIGSSPASPSSQVVSWSATGHTIFTKIWQWPTSATAFTGGTTGTQNIIGSGPTAGGYNITWELNIPNYTYAGDKSWYGQGGGASGNVYYMLFGGYLNASVAVSSLTFSYNSGSTGTISLYGLS